MKWLPTRRADVVIVATTAGLLMAGVTATVAVLADLSFQKSGLTEPERVVRLSAPGFRVLRWQREEIVRTAERLASTPTFVARASVDLTPLFEVLEQTSDLRSATVSPEFFSLAQVAPAQGTIPTWLGRSTVREVLIGDDLWTTRFGRSTGIIGRIVEVPGSIGDSRWRVVGVMPPGFDFPRQSNWWTVSAPTSQFDFYRAPVFARLNDGIDLRRVAEEFPTLEVIPAEEDGRRLSLASAAAVIALGGMVTLTGWLAIAGYASAKLVTAREKEMAVRIVLGATRLQAFAVVARDVGFMVAGAAVVCVATYPLALHSLTLLVATGPAQIGVPDLPVLAVGLSVLLMSLAHLLVLLWLKTRPTNTRRRRWMISGQIGASAALVYTCLIALAGNSAALSSHVGFDDEMLTALRVPVTQVDAGLSGAEINRRYEGDKAAAVELLGRLRASPIVRDAAFASGWPLRYAGLTAAEITSARDAERLPIAVKVIHVGERFFPTLGLPLISGAPPEPRPFNPPQPGSAVVSESLASILQSFGDVVGQTISATPLLHYEISGIARDIPVVPASGESPHLVYIALPVGAAGAIVLARGESAASDVAPVLRSLASNYWPSRSVAIVPLGDDVATTLRARRTAARGAGVAGVGCLVLASFGVWSAASTSMLAQRRPVLIRSALGARRRDLLRAYLPVPASQAVISAAAGSILGLVAATALGPSLAVPTPWSPVAVVVSVCGIASTALIATVVSILSQPTLDFGDLRSNATMETWR